MLCRLLPQGNDCGKKMANTDSIVHTLQHRRERNLAFFKQHHADIYNIFHNYTLQDHQINIDSATGTLNLLHQGKPVYTPDPQQYGQQEAEQLLEQFPIGGKLRSLGAPFAGSYCLPRFSHYFTNQFAVQSPVNATNFDYYTLPDFLPVVVFTGVGLGYRIQSVGLKHIVIIETQFDHFAASLYTTDWDDIYRQFDQAGKSIHYIIAKLEDPQRIFAHIWNRLIQLFPMFPTTTVFHNHLGNPIYLQLIERINKEINHFISVWGFYDDEINQLNNCLHNLKRVPLFKPNTRIDPAVPVVVLGSGPSLDRHIDLIYAHKERLIIVSCGSAIEALYNRGLKPDIHFEYESDKLSVIALQYIKDADYLRTTPLIAPISTNPLVFQRFDTHSAYIKTESATSTLYEDYGLVIKGGTPSCSNAALAFFLNLGSQRVYLLGMDFGFTDSQHHHAQGTSYYDDQADNLIKSQVQSIGSELIRIEAVDADYLLTTPFYYTCRAHASRAIEEATVLQQCCVYNLSRGATLEQSRLIDPEALEDHLRSHPVIDKAAWLNALFAQRSPNIEPSLLQASIDQVRQCLQQFIDSVRRSVSPDYPGLEGFTDLCHNLFYHAETQIRQQHQNVYFFVRGSAWHLIFIGYSHLYALDDETQQRDLYRIWHHSLMTMMDHWLAHFDQILQIDKTLEQDVLVQRTMRESEPYIETLILGGSLEVKHG